MNVNRLSPELIERELGAWLRDESDTRAPVGLVEDVFARTSRTTQARAWWPPTARPFRAAVRWAVGRPMPGPRPLELPRRRSISQSLGALAGLLTVAIVAVVLALGVGRTGPGPGATPTPSISRTPSATTAPSPSGSATTSSVPATLRPASPVATTVGSFAAQRLELGVASGPIDVTEAFGSIWVAGIHADEVRRYDPDTMAEVARIQVDSAAWFAATSDALWVTNQTGTGLSRIDPATNTVVAHVGDVPPCAAPVLALGALWQAACDGGLILRIDPTTNALLDQFPIDGHRFLVVAGGRLVTVGPEGLAAIDPSSGTFTTIGGGRAASEADFLASDGSTVWVKNTAGVVRLDPTDGSAVASFPYPAADAVSFAGDHAWLTVTNLGALEIDLATNEVRRTVPLPFGSAIPLEARGALWLTDFDAGVLWRVTL